MLTLNEWLEREGVDPDTILVHPSFDLVRGDKEKELVQLSQVVLCAEDGTTFKAKVARGKCTPEAQAAKLEARKRRRKERAQAAAERHMEQAQIEAEKKAIIEAAQQEAE